MKNIKYAPKFMVALIFFILLIAAILLFFGRTKPFLRLEILQSIFTGFYQHISNFTISYLLLSGIGFMWLMLGMGFKYINRLAVLILLINFVYELWIPALNTPDITDAYYGLCGTAVAFIFLLLTHKYGLQANPLYVGNSPSSK